MLLYVFIEEKILNLHDKWILTWYGAQKLLKKISFIGKSK